MLHEHRQNCAWRSAHDLGVHSTAIPAHVRVSRDRLRGSGLANPELEQDGKAGGHRQQLGYIGAVTVLENSPEFASLNTTLFIRCT
jgi:hypothetical protein